MNIILEHKTLDIFLEKRGVTKDYFEKHINDTPFRCLIEHPIWFSVRRIKSENDITLNAYINWCFPHDENPNPSEKRFPNTWEGYVSACEWLDAKRVEYIKALI